MVGGGERKNGRMSFYKRRGEDIPMSRTPSDQGKLQEGWAAF